MTITIAPIRADMIETMIRVNAHPSSPAVSAMKKTQKKKTWLIKKKKSADISEECV